MTTQIRTPQPIDLTEQRVLVGDTVAFIDKFTITQDKLEEWTSQDWGNFVADVAQVGSELEGAKDASVSAKEAAEVAAGNSSDSASESSDFATASDQARQLAVLAKEAAEVAAGNSADSADESSGFATASDQARQLAVLAKEAAEVAAGNSSDSASESSDFATASDQARQLAVLEKEAAVTAKEAAELAASRLDFFVTPFLSRQKSGHRFFELELDGLLATVKAIQPVQCMGTVFLGGMTLATGTVTPGSDYSLVFNKDTKVFSLSSNFNPLDPEYLIGGFHVFTNTEIAENSLWDMGFRPTAPDPRGMVFHQLKRKWADIYMLGQNHIVDGTSRANVNIASGTRTPKKPLAYGGDGSESYTRLSYFEARNIMASHGKFLPDLQLVASALNGSTPLIAIGSDPVTTKHEPGYRSDIGVEQSTGHLSIWTDEHSAWNGTNGWHNMGTGEGSWYGQDFRTAVAAGNWDHAGDAGPDCVAWSNSPTHSSSRISVRGFSDHKEK